jgi:hypothetical protein
MGVEPQRRISVADRFRNAPEMFNLEAGGASSRASVSAGAWGGPLGRLWIIAEGKS